MSTLTTHVLDAVAGAPAADIAIELRDDAGGLIAAARTDSDGRVAHIADVGPGMYRLTFHIGSHFRECFYPEVVITFHVDGTRHCHVPLTLSPFSYTTYRGS